MFEKRAVRKAAEELAAAQRRQRDTHANSDAMRQAMQGLPKAHRAVDAGNAANKVAAKGVKQAGKKLGKAADKLAAKQERKARGK
ncbi:hypothetical protein [Kribbella sp. NPDC048928]|uniref:hypothetical protein n=1 Tax=Kribbella sp. NPDC048928 TaxID=3364111 RepID=UPI00371A1F97